MSAKGTTGRDAPQKLMAGSTLALWP